MFKIVFILMLLTASLTATDKLANVLKQLPQERAMKITQVAKKYIGTKYRYGKWDCSKFVQKVMNESKGKKLPRTTRQQIKIGNKIPKSKEKVGDLIFFGDSKHYVGHVGIVIDPKNKLMIHNSSAKGRVVISNYETVYYRKKFRGIRRI